MKWRSFLKILTNHSSKNSRHFPEVSIKMDSQSLITRIFVQYWAYRNVNLNSQKSFKINQCIAMILPVIWTVIVFSEIPNEFLPVHLNLKQPTWCIDHPSIFMIIKMIGPCKIVIVGNILNDEVGINSSFLFLADYLVSPTFRYIMTMSTLKKNLWNWGIYQIISPISLFLWRCLKNLTVVSISLTLYYGSVSYNLINSHTLSHNL